ncbi:hypothetical protein [Streptomyces inhibens]|uniref:hypothetical protein n=1 Tax=Streptomyces inhibens TaxID=2293571 RepID=UPI001EE74A22|nr:hypothetical protein [Streptomyces inhibens]UKY54943.1 hypothetical protein KI385_43460 [Streptomyces inhibens]
MAASESPPDISVQLPAQQDPNSSGGNDQTSGGSASSTSPNNSGSDTSSGTDTTHQGTNTTPNGTTDNGGGINTGNQPSDTVKQPGNGTGGITGQRVCEKAGGLWADTPSGGYCGKTGTIQGNQQNNPAADQGQINVPPAAEQVGKCVEKLYPLTGALNDAYQVTSWTNTMQAWVKNSQTGETMKLVASAAERTPDLTENTPGPGKIVTCGRAIWMVGEQVVKNPQTVGQVLADIKKRTEQLLKNSASETPAAAYNFACAQADRFKEAFPSLPAQLNCT